MVSKDKVFHSNDMKAIWQRFCGFLDLSIDEFMEIQEALLFDQIDLVSKSPLGKHMMRNGKPKTLDEFRKNIPVTTYKDYRPFIGNCQEDALVDKPYFWAHTSGGSGDYKWVPFFQRNDEVMCKNAIAVFILASARRKGDINIRPGVRGFINFPPRPYTAGWTAYNTIKQMSAKAVPPLEKAENMEFKARTQLGLKMALKSGLDTACCMSSILVKVAETMSDETQKMTFSSYMLNPSVLFRLLRAFLRAKKEGRSMLPKDLWDLKGIVAWGVDTEAYKDKINYYWGQYPFELYVATEGGGIIASHAWNKKGLTFLPDSVFYEFIPEDDWFKSQEDTDYMPKTVLLNELEAGKRYGLVISGFYGVPFLRYRLGDLIRVISLEDDETGIALPQIVFDSRGDDMISIAGFPWFNEKFIWQVLVNTGIKYTDWTLRKEWEKDKPVLHLYMELREEKTSQEVEQLVVHHLKMADSNYNDLENMLDIKPLKVTLLSTGTFQRYYDEKHKAGFDLARLRPKHMNASDNDMKDILRLNIT